MTDSGTFAFGVSTENIDVVTEAYERAGRTADSLSANDLDSAKRSLNYLFAEWANRGPNLWAIDELRYALTTGLTSIELPVDTVSILQALVRYGTGTTQQDLVITGISRSEYFALPNKLQQQLRPTQFYLARTAPPVAYLWPVPDNSDRYIVISRMVMMRDIGTLQNTPGAPARWMDAIAAGLAARLAMKWAVDRVPELKAEAAAAFEIATREDTEAVPLSIAPDMMGMN
jgi:hypothetical protein